MIRATVLAACCVIAPAALPLPAGADPDDADLTDKIEVVGAPMGERWRENGGRDLYARNLWDLQAFQGRLYASYGDFSLNSGTVEIVSCDPQKKEFASEFQTEDQAILRYRVFDDKLLAAGNDPEGETCNLYLKEQGRWSKIETPPAKHAFDATFYAGKLFVTLQDEGGGKVAESPDGGKTWPVTYGPLDPVRTFSLFELGGALHVSTYSGTVYRYTGKGFAPAADLKTKTDKVQKLPDSKRWGDNFVVHKPVTLSKDAVCYVGWNILVDMTARQSHFNGFGLFLAAVRGGKAAAQPVVVRGLPEDVTVCDRTVYAVTNEEEGKEEKRCLIRIYVGRGTSFSEAARFRSETIARSIEVLGDDLYIGLGCTREAPSPAAGQILRLARKDLKK